MSENAISGFVVFCMESYKRHENLGGAEVSDLFIRYGVIDYLTEGYEVLHSLGENALVEDIRDYISRRR
ncbi:MAG: DUF3791 domain-containing protein [Kiritimatiellae bacterium]|jgi:hypothetical protein|nr:DUF3791 domain-containing protein [Kiritimatiellia bacterium]